MDTTYVATVTEGGHFSPCATLDEAVAIWSTDGRIVEVLDSPRPVNIRFYVDNGWDPRGWYLRSAQRVNIRTKASPRSRTWSYDTLTYTSDPNYRPEVK